MLDGETGYLVPPKDPEKLAGRVVKFFAENKNFTENIRREAHKYSWDKMVDVIEDLFTQV